MMFRAVFYGTAALVGATLGLWTIEREPPVVTLRTELSTPTVAPGGDLKIKLTVRRTKSCVTHVDRMLFDAEKARFPLPDLDYKKAPGPLGDDTYMTVIPVPEQMGEGPALYRSISSYQCNLVHLLWPVSLEPIDVPFVVSR